MGVRGLTTFISNRSKQYLENYELHDTYLVIDGNCIACQLYRWHCKCNDCFGGDYDKYATAVTHFFQLLKDCNITPLVIFDGAYEARKIKTVYSRLKSRICASRDLNSYTEGGVSVFPLFMREVFVDILLKLEIKSVRCDFECDTDVAYLARRLNCPLLSYDSDFYIMDVLYVPFNTMDLRVCKKKGVNYLRCAVYRVEKFLNSFGGMDMVNLPLLGVLLGNDYIKKGAFSRFYQQLKMQKSKENEQQRTIKSLIVWLKDETPESALRKILGRYKVRMRRRLAGKIRIAIRGYYGGDPQICQYFDLKVPEVQETSIEVPEPDEIEEMDASSGGEDDEEAETETSEDEECMEAEPILKSNKPLFFRENYRKCLYPACFMEMLSTHYYYCIPQIEDFSMEHSHAISMDMLGIIHKILTFPSTPNLTCVARNEHSGIQKYPIELHQKDTPTLAEIDEMNKQHSLNTLLNILDVNYTLCSAFPKSWHLYLLSLKYWISNSKTHINTSLIYSLLLCGIVLNYVDPKIGFYRSTKSFFGKFGEGSPAALDKPNFTKKLIQAVDQIDEQNSVSCLRKLIYYFQMDMKMRLNSRNFDRKIIHEFAQFQSCLLHIKYLNALLNFPLPQVMIADFYDGTFLYNMTVNFSKRADLKAYVKVLLESCPKILNVFELMIDEIESKVGDDMGKHEPVKKRRKKKKTKKVEVEIVAKVDESEEEFLDENNVYSLLAVINK